MIKLTKEDSKFKKSEQYPGSENLRLAATALKTTEDVRTKFGQAVPYNQQSIFGILMSVLGWAAGSKSHAKPKVDEQRLINMISGQVFERIMMLDREKKKSKNRSGPQND